MRSRTLSSAPFLRRCRIATRRFFTAPAAATPLAMFRIGVAGVLLVQGLSLAGDVGELFGPQALVPAEVLDPQNGDSSIHPFSPRLRFLEGLLSPVGITATETARLTFLLYLAMLSCLLIGWQTRCVAAVAWLAHLALNNAATATIYGVDMFAHISLFYCTVFPVGATFSIDAAGRRATPSAMNRLALRVLQLHLCVVYFSSAIEKAAGPQWWNGEAIWRSVTLPELATFDMTWLAAVPWFAVLAGWGTLAVEAGYAVLIWPKRTRTAMALATIGMHVGIGATMGLVSFSALMVVLTAAAFLVTPEPRRPAAASVGRFRWPLFSTVKPRAT
ncbi:MAG: HTTM domain-containing protein [Planctomycetaceae bacterium]